MPLENIAEVPRLNPFAFPSETSFRFALLMVSVIGVSLIIFNILYNNFSGNWERDQALQAQCREFANARYPSSQTTWMFGGTSEIEKIRVYNECIAPMDRSRAMWMMGGVIAVLGVAGLLYWVYPAWKIRRERLVPLDAEDAPELTDYLAELCREAGLPLPPIFLLNPLNPAPTGLAFGHVRQRYIVINGGLVRQFYQDMPAFRAVVFHELGHLYNADVDKTYFSVSVWQAFVIVALVPFLVVLLSRPFSQFFYGMGWRALALVPLVYLTRNAVLRIREVYADLSASLWDRPKSALDRVLATLPGLKGERWLALLQVHPDPTERRRMLQNTDGLFRMSHWEALGTGIATSVAFINIDYFLSLFTPVDWAYLGSLGAATIFAPLAVAIVGIGVWRETFAAIMRGAQQRRAGLLGLSLGFGYILGQKLSFIDYAFLTSETALTGADLFTFYALQGGLVLFSLFLFLHWIAAGASGWLEVTIADRSPRLAYWIGLTLASVLLVIWLGFLSYVVDNIRGIGGTSIPQEIDVHSMLSNIVGVSVPNTVPRLLAFTALIIMGLLRHPLTLAIFISLWAFPLAAWFWRSRSGLVSASHWAFLDPPTAQLPVPPQPPIRLDIAIRVGLIGGFVYWVLALILSRVFQLVAPEASAYARYDFYLSGLPFVAALTQAGVAAIVVLKVERLAVLHSLFAAFVGGCVMSAGALATSALYEGISLLKGSGKIAGVPIISAFSEGMFVIEESYWIIISQVINGGALLALFVALGMIAIMRLFTSQRGLKR